MSSAAAATAGVIDAADTLGSFAPAASKHEDFLPLLHRVMETEFIPNLCEEMPSSGAVTRFLQGLDARGADHDVGGALYDAQDGDFSNSVAGVLDTFGADLNGYFDRITLWGCTAQLYSVLVMMLHHVVPGSELWRRVTEASSQLQDVVSGLAPALGFPLALPEATHKAPYCLELLEFEKVLRGVAWKKCWPTAVFEELKNSDNLAKRFYSVIDVNEQARLELFLEQLHALQLFEAFLLIAIVS